MNAHTAEYPGWFASRELAEAYAEPFFDWYNHEHHHSGLGLFTPDQVHTGKHLKVQKIRQAALDAAYGLHPKRFVKGRPTPPQLAPIVAINPEPGLIVGEPKRKPAPVLA